jgi:hypothetical protein
MYGKGEWGGGGVEALGLLAHSPPPHAPLPLARHLHKVTLLHATTTRTAAGARAGGGGGEQSRPLRSPRLPTPPSIPRSRHQP